MQTNIAFSERAADKVRQLMHAENNAELKLRVFITGGGCSGFSYASPSMKKLPTMTR